MNPQAGVWAAVACYCVAMAAIGVWAARRTRDTADFFLGGRRFGAWLTALSQGSTQSSAWTLIGVSGAAYSWGVSAAWIWLAVVAGYAANWFLVAPRLRRLSAEQGSVTLVQLLTDGLPPRVALATRRSASVIVVFSFLFYVAAQFQAAGAAFSLALGLDVRICVVTGAVLIVGYTLVGGFWAASVTDVVQAGLMLLAAVVLPAAALAAAGGLAPVLHAATAGGGDLLGGRSGAAALAFVLGTFGIGLAAPGQPHVVNHFMAARDDAAIRTGGVIALGWIALVLAGMLLVGWAGRLLAAPPGNPESVLYAASHAWLPALAGGFVTVAVMSAIMSTVDSQLITATSSLTVDWTPGSAGTRLAPARAVLLLFSAAAAAIALLAPATIYSRVLFAWNALGAAFGPLVVLVCIGLRPPARAVLACMWTGFLLTVVFYLMPDAEGDVLERVVPFVVSLAVAWWLSGRREPAAP